MVNDLRGAFYARLQRSSLAFHGRQRVGDLLYRITADSFAVLTMIMNGALPILSALVLLTRMLHAGADRRSYSVCPDLAIQP
jgi:ATP-binding cassette subfamily B protein/subfamily B ATP-binding cassette protein MsbA